MKLYIKNQERHVECKLTKTQDKICCQFDNRVWDLRTQILSQGEKQGHFLMIRDQTITEVLWQARNCQQLDVYVGGQHFCFERTLFPTGSMPTQQHQGVRAKEVRTVMPGKILETMVKAGDRVDRDQTLLIIEAMKMENEIKAPVGGMVKQLHVAAGQSVEAQTLLLRIEEPTT